MTTQAMARANTGSSPRDHCSSVGAMRMFGRTGLGFDASPLALADQRRELKIFGGVGLVRFSFEYGSGCTASSVPNQKSRSRCIDSRSSSATMPWATGAGFAVTGAGVTGTARGAHAASASIPISSELEPRFSRPNTLSPQSIARATTHDQLTY